MEATSQQITKRERRLLKKEQKKQEKLQNHKRERNVKVLKYIGATLIVAVVFISVLFLFGSRKTLPPKTLEGHIETSPPSHILNTPMDVRVHKHMLEHADGSGPPGIIINYNCEDFNCEPNLVEKLTKIVNDYPQHLYLAPYPSMSAKLVITRYGEQEILNEFDEKKIREFIER